MATTYVTIDKDRMPYFATPKPVKIFDVDKKEMIANFETVKDAAKYLGLCHSVVLQIIKYKRRNTTNKLGLTITCR